MALSTGEMIDDLIPYQLLQEGLRVFVIDHDNTQLHAIAGMCSQCNYQVITCNMASYALHLLRQTNPPFFDLILIDAQMADMDSYHFLQCVTQETKIPVIIMSCLDHHTTSAITKMKAIQKGASDYWLKPLNLNLINNMWQHVQQQHDQIQTISEVVKTGQKRMKRDEESETKETNKRMKRDEESETKETNKNRVSWLRTPKLQENFLRVVNQLGIDKATPKQITELMAVPGLKTAHVASHLQKFRLRLKSENKKTKSNSKQRDQYHHVPNQVPSLAVTTDTSALNLHASGYDGSISMPCQTGLALAPDTVYSCQTGLISSPDAVRSCETGLIANSCQMGLMLPSPGPANSCQTGSILPSPYPAENQAVNDDDILSMLDIFNDSEENIASEGALLGDFFEGLEDLDCSALGSFGQNAEFSTNGMATMGDVGCGDLDFHFPDLADLDSELFWQSTAPTGINFSQARGQD